MTTARVRAYLEALLPLAAIAQEPSLSFLFSAQERIRILESQNTYYLDATWEGKRLRPRETWESFDHLKLAIMADLYTAADAVGDAILNALVGAVERDSAAADAGLIGADRLRREVLRWLRSPNRRALRAFLSYCREDAESVRKLYDQLTSAGIDVWLDEVALLPGQDWKIEIEKSVRRSDVVIVCLSARAITKIGYVQKEIREALQFADEHPPGTVFVIPVRLDDCVIPSSLKHLHCVDVWTGAGYQKLLLSLQQRSLQIES